MTEAEWARALMDLWEAEGGECHHGFGYATDCAELDCPHNPVRPALRRAAEVLERNPW